MIAVPSFASIFGKRGAFFAKCAELLAPDGIMALQAITILDRLYDRARRHVDFIKRYIFPGSCIPSLAALGPAVARASDVLCKGPAAPAAGRARYS